MSISKAIPGFESVRVVNGGLKFSDGTACTLPVTQDNKIVIPIRKKVITATIGWIEDFAFHRMHLSRELLENLEDLYFVPQRIFSKKRPIATVPVLKKPILINGQYRLIPRYSRYAIDKRGQAVDLETRLQATGYCEISGYLALNVWDTAIHEWINVPVHRLIGYAWVDNDDFVEKYLINHMDGDKTNNDPTNLEWTSYEKNNTHAIKMGLRTYVRAGNFRDVKTGEVTSFFSFGEALRLMGADKKVQYRYQADPSYLWFDRYEVRMNDDTRPWFYETRALGTKVGRYQITVTHPDGRKEIFYTVNEMRATFDVPNIYGKPVQRSIELIESARPGTKIEIQDLYANARIVRSEMRMKTPVLPPRCIEATHNESNQVLQFKSLHSAARHFQVDRQVIKDRLSSGKNFNNWSLKELSS